VSESRRDEPNPAEPRTLLRADVAFPRELMRLPDPPEMVRVRGVLPALSRAVAIVGTRRPTSRGERFAHGLAAELGRSGCVIVSGGAFGIDHAAHLGALEAGAPTVVVHASGLGRPYPAAHRGLYERVVEAGGCEVSERPDDGWPAPSHFLARNRLIAALARVVVVVEAPVRSGALSTAVHARAIGVPLLAVPRVPETPESEGSNGLLRRGARPCMAASDVLEIVEGTTTLALPEPTALDRRRKASAGARPREAHGPDLSAETRAVLAAIDGGAGEVDEIVGITKLPLPAVLVAVADLEVLGLVSETLTGQLSSLG